MLRRPAAVILLATILAVGADAQELRGSGGLIEVLPKGTSRTSASATVSRGTGSSALDATLGGTIVKDRVWFFASANLTERSVSSFVPSTAPSGEAMDARLTAQLGNWQNLAASYGSNRADVAPFGSTVLPSSFLTLRYDAVISPNAIFSANVSRRTVTTPLLPLD